MIERLAEVFQPLADLIAEVPLLGFELARNPLWLWLLALLAAAVFYGLLRLLMSQILKRLGRLSAHTRTAADDVLVDVLRGTTRAFVAVLALLIASLLLELSGTAADIRRWLVVIALTAQVGLWGQRAVSAWIDHQKRQLAETDPSAANTLQGLSILIRGAVWAAVVVLMLQNLGYDVGALLAGLGIGGIAIALALQNVLGDLFASLSITLDKPFEVGDFVIVGDMLGTVSHVGLKTTRIRSLSGEQLVFSNSDLLSSRIRNYKRMDERRVLFNFGVLYQTTTEQLEGIPATARAIVDDVEDTRFDRAHFKEFGDSAYVFEVVYYVLNPDYNLFMDIQEKINLSLCRRFEAEGIEFAYPTRTLHLASATGPALVRVENA